MVGDRRKKQPPRSVEQPRHADQQRNHGGADAVITKNIGRQRNHSQSAVNRDKKDQPNRQKMSFFQNAHISKFLIAKGRFGGIKFFQLGNLGSPRLTNQQKTQKSRYEINDTHPKEGPCRRGYRQQTVNQRRRQSSR